MEIKHCNTMTEWFSWLESLMVEDSARTWISWEDSKTLELGCQSNDGIVVAYKLAAFRKHYNLPHFAPIEKERKAFEQYRQEVGIILNK